MLNSPLETLKTYIDMPSGSLDKEDVEALAAIIEQDFLSLGFKVEKRLGQTCGPTLVCTIGQGQRQLMLMGHMDTVFPKVRHIPLTRVGDNLYKGSGIVDMKGGIVVMLYALKSILPGLDLTQHKIVAVINPDEEIGSPESGSAILETAKASFAALSFENAGKNNMLTCARKGVTSAFITCVGIPGHAGSEYKKCASAIQALCAQITKLYTLRDDAQDISFNAGLITGGTAENVVAPEASCKCEFRYFDQRLKQTLIDKITALCADEPVKGVTTTVTFGSSHPAIDINKKSQKLFDMASALAKAQGRTFHYERTGGAGDIAIAGLAGIPVLDGLGLNGGGAHTKEEYADLTHLDAQIDLGAQMIQKTLYEYQP